MWTPAYWRECEAAAYSDPLALFAAGNNAASLEQVLNMPWVELVAWLEYRLPNP